MRLMQMGKSHPPETGKISAGGLWPGMAPAKSLTRSLTKPPDAPAWLAGKWRMARTVPSRTSPVGSPGATANGPDGARQCRQGGGRPAPPFLTMPMARRPRLVPMRIQTVTAFRENAMVSGIAGSVRTQFQPSGGSITSIDLPAARIARAFAVLVRGAAAAGHVRRRRRPCRIDGCPKVRCGRIVADRASRPVVSGRVARASTGACRRDWIGEV